MEFFGELRPEKKEKKKKLKKGEWGI